MLGGTALPHTHHHPHTRATHAPAHRLPRAAPRRTPTLNAPVGKVKQGSGILAWMSALMAGNKDNETAKPKTEYNIKLGTSIKDTVRCAESSCTMPERMHADVHVVESTREKLDAKKHKPPAPSAAPVITRGKAGSKSKENTAEAQQKQAKKAVLVGAAKGVDEQEAAHHVEECGGRPGKGRLNKNNIMPPTAGRPGLAGGKRGLDYFFEAALAAHSFIGLFSDSEAVCIFK